MPTGSSILVDTSRGRDTRSLNTDLAFYLPAGFPFRVWRSLSQEMLFRLGEEKSLLVYTQRVLGNAG